MEWKMKYAILLIPILALAFIPFVYGTTSEVITSDFARFNIPATGRFGVNHADQNVIVQITVLTGTFLGNGTVTVETFAGSIAFYSESACSIYANSSISNIDFVVNDNSNSSTITASISSGVNNIIRWSLSYHVWLPIHLAIGGMGLAFLCIVPVMAIKKFKEKNYVWTMVWGSVGILVGIALVIAWLWI